MLDVIDVAGFCSGGASAVHRVGAEVWRACRGAGEHTDYGADDLRQQLDATYKS